MSAVTQLDPVDLTLVEMHSNLLDGRALNWAVAEAVGYEPRIVNGVARINECGTYLAYEPTVFWEQCGQLMDDYINSIHKREDVEHEEYWAYAVNAEHYSVAAFASEKRVAICRAVVMAKRGPVVRVPAVLLEGGQ